MRPLNDDEKRIVDSYLLKIREHVIVPIVGMEEPAAVNLIAGYIEHEKAEHMMGFLDDALARAKNGENLYDILGEEFKSQHIKHDLAVQLYQRARRGDIH